MQTKDHADLFVGRPVFMHSFGKDSHFMPHVVVATVQKITRNQVTVSNEYGHVIKYNVDKDIPLWSSRLTAQDALDKSKSLQLGFSIPETPVGEPVLDTCLSDPSDHDIDHHAFTRSPQFMKAIRQARESGVLDEWLADRSPRRNFFQQLAYDCATLIADFDISRTNLITVSNIANILLDIKTIINFQLVHQGGDEALGKLKAELETALVHLFSNFDTEKHATFSSPIEPTAYTDLLEETNDDIDLDKLISSLVAARHYGLEPKNADAARYWEQAQEQLPPEMPDHIAFLESDEMLDAAEQSKIWNNEEFLEEFADSIEEAYDEDEVTAGEISAEIAAVLVDPTNKKLRRKLIDALDSYSETRDPKYQQEVAEVLAEAGRIAYGITENDVEQRMLELAKRAADNFATNKTLPSKTIIHTRTNNPDLAACIHDAIAAGDDGGLSWQISINARNIIFEDDDYRKELNFLLQTLTKTTDETTERYIVQSLEQLLAEIFGEAAKPQPGPDEVREKIKSNRFRVEHPYIAQNIKLDPNKHHVAVPCDRMGFTIPSCKEKVKAKFNVNKSRKDDPVWVEMIGHVKMSGGYFVFQPSEYPPSDPAKNPFSDIEYEVSSEVDWIEIVEE